MKQNYDVLFQKTVQEINKDSQYANSKPRLLLHVCCAPCSSAVLEKLVATFDITIYYYNPNIHPREEYARRLDELKEFIKKCPQEIKYGYKSFELQTAHYEPDEYFEAVETDSHPDRKSEQERGVRCSKCYEVRLKKSAIYAKEHNFDYFTTALSISPHKDAQKINEIGETIQKAFQEKNLTHKTPKYLYADFKKHHGFKRSLELSKEFSLYRQDYCGCIYSQINMRRDFSPS